MEVVLPITLATGTGDGLHLQSERRVVLRLEFDRSNPLQARAPKLVQANEMVAVQRKSDLRPPLRWGLNE